MKYSDLMVEWLVDEGYTHCFFVAGGNIMHLLDGVRQRMTCIATVHEVAAGIGAEYFNESGGAGRAFALVTAGPGLTNLVSAMAGAYLEHRELLVIGGQVKSTDLATGGLRQRGIQEVDGVAVAAPVTVTSRRIEAPMPRDELVALVRSGTSGRPGPVFLEVCLDAQGAPVEREELDRDVPPAVHVPAEVQGGGRDAVERVTALMAQAERPVWLLGGGVSREAAAQLLPRLAAAGVPLMTTWNGADRLPADHPLAFGRPNTWGMRSSNVLLQQCDLLVALGTRLGLQQTGFNHEAFVPRGLVVQVDLAEEELHKGHPRVDLPLRADADEVLAGIAQTTLPRYDAWVDYCRDVRARLPLQEPFNTTAPDYVDPYVFADDLSDLCRSSDVVIPCSSGGAFTSMMQAFRITSGQVMVTNKGLASMGYGLSGAIGAAVAHPDRRVILVEGDGGFAQNLQELATVAVNGLDLKVFLFANEGYASIRMTQRNYFGGSYLGCDVGSGLGFPDWPLLFRAFGIPVHALGVGYREDPEFATLLDAPGPAAFVVPIDPEQTYFPKISSRVTATGGMESNPLHLMSPDLPDDVAAHVLAYAAEPSRSSS